MQLIQETIRGAGGGGSKGHTPIEAPNSLRSRTTARLLFLTSRGEIGGLADQSNPLKSVYFNNTPVQNADGTLNLSSGTAPAVKVEERYGLPSQAVMDGYPSASNSFSVNQKVTTGTPVSYTSSVGNIDVMRITVRFPALFEQADNGDTNGTQVQFEIYRRLGAGAWQLFTTVTKRDKTNSPADVDYPVPRPSGAGTWGVQVRRVTADNALSTKANDIYFFALAEIQNVQLPYNGFAYCGVTVSAETTGSTYPTVAFDLYGLKIKVPSNYNVITRAYTGQWNGSFSGTRQVCNNPAWVLYDLLTNADYGLGSVVSEADIDKFSFYDAAVYCDGLVPRATGGGNEPRYTFDYQFMEQQDSWTMLQNVAAAMGAVIYTAGNKIKLVQDRPTNWSRLITNSNVIADENGVQFNYTSSQKSSRATACIVFWNDPDQNGLSVPAYYEDTSATNRYGYNVKEVAGIGITSEGQALRLAKWTVDTSVNTTDSVLFKVGFENAGLEPGEVIKIADSDFASFMGEAKVLSGTATTVTVDRPLVVSSGNTFDVLGADGVSIETRTITSSGTLSTFSFSGAAIATAAGATLVLTGAVSPRLFKVVGVKEESAGQYAVSAVEYDANKYGRVDSTPTGLTPVYQATPSMTVVSPVTGIAFVEESYTNPDGMSQRRLVVTWTPPAGQFVNQYQVFWRKDCGYANDLGEIQQPACNIPVDSDGLYTVMVYAINVRGVRSFPAVGEKVVAIVAPGFGSSLPAVTDLQVKGGGTSFVTADANFEWTAPTAPTGTVLAGYEVQVQDITTSTVYRTELVNTPAYGYTLSKQQADHGSSYKRSFKIQVKAKDTWGRLSGAAVITATNPAPAAPTGVSINGGYGSVFVSWDKPADADYAGTLVWLGNATGFALSPATLIADGNASFCTKTNLSDSTAYFVKLAHYDTFGKSLAGTGLSVSAEFTATSKTGSGVAVVGTLPGTGTNGQIVLLSTDNKLYRWNGTAWVTAVSSGVEQVTSLPGTGTAGQVVLLSTDNKLYRWTGSAWVTAVSTGVEPVSSLPGTGSFEGQMVYLTTDDKIYRWTGSAWISSVSAVDISGQLTAAQLAAIEASKVTGQIVNTQISDNSISTAKIQTGSITAGSGIIANAAIGNAQIDRGTANKLVIVTADIATANITNALIDRASVNKLVIGTADIASAAIGNVQIDRGTANKLVIGTADIASAAIGNAQIDRGTANKLVIGTADIADATITNAKIVSLTGDKIVANTITADKINSNGLTIRDNSGNVIFGVGTNLSSSYITPDSGWLNSNLTPSINTAQTTANNAATAAGTAQTTAGNAATAASTAQTAANNAATAASAAQTTANNAATAASNAQTAANTANTAIANITSDSVLSKGEKPAVVLEWTTLDNERAGIVSQASALSVSTTAYEAAKSALDTYLYNSIGPHNGAWSDTSVDSSITPSTFQQKFADVYATRQALLNAISAAAATRAAWANVSGVPSNVTNATAGRVFRQSTAPTAPLYVGDTWYRPGQYGTSVLEILTWNGSSWTQQMRAPVKVVVGGSAWSDSLANSAIAGGAAPGDIVEITNGGSFTDTRMLSGDANGWARVVAKIDGSLLVSGSVAASAIYATSLSALSTTTGSLTVNGDLVTSGLSAIKTNTFPNGYSWAGTSSGFYLSSRGLLLGGGGPSSRVEIAATGDCYFPQFSIVGGSATFSGTLSAVTGSFGDITLGGLMTTPGKGSYDTGTGIMIGRWPGNGQSYMGVTSTASGSLKGMYIASTDGILYVTGGVITGGTITNPTLNLAPFTAACTGGGTQYANSAGSYTTGFSASVSASGGDAPYTYSWSIDNMGEGTASLSSSTSATCYINTRTPQGYTTSANVNCIVTDKNGRTASGYVSVQVVNGIQV